MNRLRPEATITNPMPAPGFSSRSRPRTESASNGDRAVPVPGAAHMYTNGADRKNPLGGPPPLFDLARSPPAPTANASGKNTKHVPCKFFRQNACQAGNACPFSHSLDPINQQAPCKYFMRGNCKFGAKCALAHYLPDGRRVNRADLDVGLAITGANGRNYNYSTRPDQHNFHPQDSNLVDPLLNQPSYGPEFFPTQSFPLDVDEPDAFQDRYNQHHSHSALDSAVNSPPNSHYGSPPSDLQFPKSPVENIRTALNAPLPHSFDANGISHIAQYGPLGQSVPDKFGLRSPASSSLSRQLGTPPEGIVNVRNANLGSTLRNAPSPLGLSPANAEESIGQRIMHSQRAIKARGLSASVPRSHIAGHEWEEGLSVETDLLPNSLHDEVLTPQEKSRRLSRPEQEYNARDQTGGLAIPSGTSSKVGSPPTGSPSRFSALWAEQRERKSGDPQTSTSLGHVGSPLRGSWMPNEPTTANTQVSGISQAMARMQLGRTDSTESNGNKSQLISGLRHSSAPVARFDRGISSPGLTSQKIEEEVEGAFFPMDETNWSGHSPRLTPLRERANGELQRSKRDPGEERSMWSFRG
ncbi:hypothetical protein B0A52_00605 [Exophiala mesophila]|uniref:C3H1-type domain-containing protein n=1 Tax=Exophiala mesophila TaxID=212818 RepID=A0A438NHP7_EXOME|nr:hypothetical protein B0A52_00605 [Exophiala mesophila]